MDTTITAIDMIQSTALGGMDNPRDTTIIHVYCSDDGYPGLEMTTKKDHYMQDMYRGHIVIRHPEVMAGSWEENVAAFKVACRKKLLDLGLVRDNGIGVLHWI